MQATGPDRLTDSATASRSWHDALYYVAGTAAVLLVLAIYGFLPGMSEVPLRATYSTGMITCLHDQGVSSLWRWCMDTGLPVGTPALTGWVPLHVGWLLSYVPGISPWTANHLVSTLVVIAGFTGTLLLLRRWSAPRWLAILASFSYLVGPNLLQLNGFVYTIDGYMLLPAYAYAGVRVLDLMQAGRWIIASLGAIAVGFTMTFTDGYSFFGGAAVLGCLVAAWMLGAWRRREVWQGLLAGLVWLAALGIPSLAYTRYVPAGAYEATPPLESFAMLGVDAASLFVPSARFLYPSLFGLAPSFRVWGSEATPPTNYLGFLMLAIAAIGLVLVVVRRWQLRGEVLAVASALLITLVLALGPSLKFAQFEPGLENSVLTLPTSFLYEHVPGLSSMRATNRWLVVTRFCLVLLFGVGVAMMWRTWAANSVRRAAVVAVVALLAVAEVLPSVRHIIDERRASAARVDLLDSGIVAEADRLLRDDELILMLPSVNDFLADYLVPVVGVRSFNAGIDKNIALSKSSWPLAVRRANNAYGKPAFGDRLCTVLARRADVVVLPYMDSRNGPLLHSNDPAVEAAREAYARSVATDPRFEAEVGQWLTVLRAAPSGPCARPPVS